MNFHSESAFIRGSIGTTLAPVTAAPATSPTPTRDAPLLTPHLMRQLDRLDLLSRKLLRGRMAGERRSKKRGQSVEFADFRNYVVGDDLRRVDWNLYARLDKLFLRLFLEEEDLSVSIAVDVTRSMDFGKPNKLRYAKQLAAALGYIALSHYNRVSVHTVTTTVRDSIQGLRGRRPIPRMIDFLDAAAPDPPGDGGEAAGDLPAALRRVGLLQRGPGVVIVISDFLEKGDLSAGLRYLASERLDTYVIQLLSPEEVDPTKGDVVGDIRLRDVEDRSTAEISIGPALLKRYRHAVDGWCKHVRDACHRRDVAYLFTQTDVPVEDVVLRYFRQRGLLG